MYKKIETLKYMLDHLEKKLDILNKEINGDYDYELREDEYNFSDENNYEMALEKKNCLKLIISESPSKKT